MDALEVIYTRRSIRRFTGEVISDELLQKILKAGFQAPSAHNRQPWEFVVINDKNKLRKVMEFHRYAQMAENAGCGILVCGDSSKQQTLGFLVEDCSAAIENMLLAIHSLNLGGVWCGVYPKEDLMEGFTKLLELPPHIIPIGFVVVGHKDEEKAPRDNYDVNKIHYNKW